MSSSNLLQVLLSGVPVKGISQNFLDALLALLVLSLSVLYIIGGKNGLLARRRKAKTQAELVEKFPGLKGYPFIGSCLEMNQVAFSPCARIMPWSKKMMKKFGPIYKFWLPGQPKMMIFCTDTALKLLQNDSFRAKPSEVMIAARSIGGEGLLALTPDIHGPRKKMWLQGLSKKHIDGNIKIFRQEAIRLCGSLRQFEGTGEVFDFMNHAINCTFRTIAYSAFGEDYMNKLPESVGNSYVHNLHTLALNMMDRVFRPWLDNDLLYYYFTPRGMETRKCIQFCTSIAQQAIDDRRLLARENDTKRPKEKLPCFMDHLLDLQERGLLTDTQVLQELNVFIVAGYDTSGLTMCFVLYLLSLNPDHQTKIVEELKEIFGENIFEFSEITPAHVKEMRYLEMCIKETLRFYPIAPFAFRRSAKEVTIPDGRIIPEGVDVYIPLDYIHQDPRYFPEPEKFIPDRHSVPIPAFIPFSLGSRNCIGQVYAMQEMKIILAHLLMMYKWETTEKRDIQFIMCPLLVPENGMHFKITKRFSS